MHGGGKFKPESLRSRMRNEEKSKIPYSCYSCIKWPPGAYESILGKFSGVFLYPIGLLAGSRVQPASEWLDRLCCLKKRAEQGIICLCTS
ncbi:hypothetical protein TNCT_157541 [Trichonephila clavata]|uniref:Uncharacterized protein n=1 Tax=Trichonephila clavata TaxID=2740835 RepID=A0A8X6GQS4_TRICU|nr:hypothetical protein TNCT_157541 [Trichonephila clavata]